MVYQYSSQCHTKELETDCLVPALDENKFKGIPLYTFLIVYSMNYFPFSVTRSQTNFILEVDFSRTLTISFKRPLFLSELSHTFTSVCAKVGIGYILLAASASVIFSIFEASEDLKAT